MKYPREESLFIGNALKTFAFAFILASMSVVTLAQTRGDTPGKITIVNDLAASASLEQCRNGAPSDDLTGPQCVDTGGGDAGWVGGNAGASNAHWAEGQYIAYRMLFSDLAAGTHTVTIGYDILDNGAHAIDYLGTYNATETDADPCSGVTGCTGWPVDTDAIPLDPDLVGEITQEAGVFTFFGAVITNSQYVACPTGDDIKQCIQITFTVDAAIPNPVLAWGGHIASKLDWDPEPTASTISGSPYHMRLIELDGSGGNQDRSLSSAAVVVPAFVTIVKQVNGPQGATTSLDVFTFQAFSTGLSANTPEFVPNPFTLIDDDGGVNDRKTSAGIQLFGASNSIVVSETNIPFPWQVTDVNCVESVTQNSTKSADGTTTATVILEEGETVTCTFQNDYSVVTAAPASVMGRVTNSFGRGISGASVTLLDLGTGEATTALTNSFGYYTFTDVETEQFYMLSVRKKGYRFSTSSYTFTLNADLGGMDFVSSN